MNAFRLFITTLLGLFLLTVSLTTTFASEIREAALAQDTVAEKRLQGLSEELRCLVCQNQTIADSNAELAQDLRREIRGMIRDGRSDKEIIDFMVVRYGDFVLYRPPVKGITLLLWGGPLAFLILGIILLQRYLRRREALVAASEPLSAAELGRAEALLKEVDKK